MTTSLPLTSRPAKSAAVPDPTQTASRSAPPLGPDGEPVAGLTDPKVVDFPSLVIDSSYPVGNHCGGRSKYWRCTSCSPNCLNFASTTPSTMSSYFVPATRPHRSSPSALLRSETATISRTYPLM